MGKRTRARSRVVNGRKEANESQGEYAKRIGGRVPKPKKSPESR